MSRQLTNGQAAHAMGMKAREVTAVEAVPGGWAVTTMDGQRTFLDEDRRPAGPYDPAAPAPVPAPEPDLQASEEAGDGMPDGTEKQVLDWVGEDTGRAAQALEAENAKGSPRKGLVTKLHAMVG